MRKNSIILIIATLMLFSSFTVGLEASVAGNSNWFQASPQNLPGPTEVGNVYIYANGTVSNSSAVYHVSGTNTYSLMSNVNGAFYIQRNNTVLNGNGLTIDGVYSNAVVVTNITGLTIDNITVVNSAPGISLVNVQNAVINDVFVNNTNSFSTSMVFAEYSNNITVENSNFSLGATATSSYGVYAEYGSNVNVSNNVITGSSYAYFVYAYAVAQFDAFGNTVLSSYGSEGTGIYAESDGNVVVANNYVNNTYYGIQIEYANSAQTMNNFVSNSSYGIWVGYGTYYTSFGDVTSFGINPMYLNYVAHALVQNDRFTSSSSDILAYYSALTMGNITFSSTSSQYGIVIQNGGNFNLYNSNFTVNTTSSITGYDVGFEFTTGWANLVNDNLVGGTYGFFTSNSPRFNVTGSYINASSYGIYANNNAVMGSTVSGNTFVVPGAAEAVYFIANDIYNVNVSNNSAFSSNTSWGNFGFNLLAYNSAFNITVANNYILHNNNSIQVRVQSGESGTSLRVLNNTIVDSITAIYETHMFNTVIKGNLIVNTTAGMHISAYGPNTTVSNNLVENLPGFGSMAFGLEVQDLSGGYNVVSNNTIIDPGFSGESFFLYAAYNVLVYSNTVTGGSYGYNLQLNVNIEFFGNSLSKSNYGIYSIENRNFQYYGNSVVNANYSFYSSSDYGGAVFANTFMDTQVNNSALYFAYVISNVYPIILYHNNFINSTTNSTTYYDLTPATPLLMYEPLPVGGNYYSNYTGSGSNGIGNTPVNFTSGVQDLFPLLKEWTSPTVTFVESGLASGTSWSVMFGSSPQKGSGSSIVFQQTNGQYTTESYSVMNVPGYTASVTSGTLSLSGTSNVVTVDFTPITYGVTFTETGLANGTSWSVTLNGDTQTTTNSSVTFNVANGTYSYEVGNVTGYTTVTSTGTVAVSGSLNSVNVQFNRVEYNLTLVELGLPSGDLWTVTIGGNSYSSTNDSMVVLVPTGTYNITVTGPKGYAVTLPSSNVTVNSVNQTFTVMFSIAGGVSPSTFYGVAGAGLFFGGAAAALGTMFVTGSGIFRKPEE